MWLSSTHLLCQHGQLNLFCKQWRQLHSPSESKCEEMAGPVVAPFAETKILCLQVLAHEDGGDPWTASNIPAAPEI